MANNQTFEKSKQAVEYEKKTKEYEKAVEQAITRLQGGTPLGVDVQDAFNRLANRQPFSYDISGDGLYQQYKNQYVSLGKNAMQDAVAKASELTGGYGNSYAVTAGEQAYQSYLDKLNHMVPALYQLAYDRYNNQTKELQNQYEMLLAQDKEQYSRLQEETDHLWGLANYYADRETDLVNRETDLWQQALERADALAKLDYQKQRDAISDAQWEKDYALAMRKMDTSSSKTTGKLSQEQTAETSLVKTSKNWDAGQWEAYFARLRDRHGYQYAADTLARMTAEGTIPKDMISFGVLGVKGKLKGH